MRAVGNSKREVFDPTTRLMHWLTAGLVLSVFVLAFSIDLATSRYAHGDAAHGGRVAHTQVAR